MNKIDNKKGFTIIEVVLVLAIAALLILMVFLAWPALQRSQRDQARKDDAAAIATIIGTWRTNHNGNMPDIGDIRTLAKKRGLSQYEPDTTEMVKKTAPTDTEDLVASEDQATGPTVPAWNKLLVNQLVFVPKAKCKTDGAGNYQVSPAGSRQSALLYVAEGNGTPTAQCLDA